MVLSSLQIGSALGEEDWVKGSSNKWDVLVPQEDCLCLELPQVPSEESQGFSE